MTQFIPMLEEGTWREVKRPLEANGLYDLRHQEGYDQPLYAGGEGKLVRLGTYYEKQRHVIACRGRLKAWAHLHKYNGKYTGEQVQKFLETQRIMFTIADRLKILIQIAQIFHPDVNKTTELIQEIQKKMDVPEMFHAANSRLAPEGLTPPGEFAFSGFKLHLREYGHYLATILEGADGNYGISAEVRDRVTDNENVIIEPR